MNSLEWPTSVSSPPMSLWPCRSEWPHCGDGRSCRRSRWWSRRRGQTPTAGFRAASRARPWEQKKQKSAPSAVGVFAENCVWESLFLQKYYKLIEMTMRSTDLPRRDCRKKIRQYSTRQFPDLGAKITLKWEPFSVLCRRKTSGLFRRSESMI